MSLIEILLLKSIYNCQHQADIVRVIENQPLPQVFFKSFDEIEMSNMITQLSNDSRLIEILLDEKNNQYFNQKYPLFYYFLQTNKNKKDQLKSAIDISLESNQVRATSLIINYIIKHQNSFIYQYLFKTNLIHMINRGVEVSKLLSSDIFLHQFDFELWPSTHLNGKTESQIYNHSFFELRDMYNFIFKGNFGEKEQSSDDQGDRIYKIKYTMNLLPSIDLQDASLMEALSETEELEIFDCKVVKELIEFKWTTYAGRYHYVGAFIHLVFVLTFNYYVSYCLQKNFILTKRDNPFVGELAYQFQDHIKKRDAQIEMYTLNVVLMVCLIYPLVYDMT